MDGDKLCLHPYRKRKFFYGLAELFGEDTPVIRRIEDAFPALSPRADAVGAVASDGNGDGADDVHRQEQSKVVDPSVASHEASLPPSSASSEEPEEDSFEFVELDKSRQSQDTSARLGARASQSSSLQDSSMQDSALFLPAELKPVAFTMQPLLAPRVTTLGARSIDSGGVDASPPHRSMELADYYDSDRHCEPTPCWAYSNQASCPIHTSAVRRPMLLFCMQALDEFIALHTLLHATNMAPWVVQACRVARTVFASSWEADQLNRTGVMDVVLSDYVTQKASMPGVALAVWRLIDDCWAKHKHNFLHHHELCFDDSANGATTPNAAQWHRVREWLQVFGMRPSQARRLVETHEADETQPPSMLSDRQMQLIAQGFPSLLAVQFGLHYFECLYDQCDEDPLSLQPQRQQQQSSQTWRRCIMNQHDWKVAFRAIELQLRRWSPGVNVYACGGFSRRAAFGSTVDVVVALPEASQEPHDRADGDQVHLDDLDAVLARLAEVRVVDLKKAYHITRHRALCMVPFKSSLLILDVKVYRRPQSWFALLYYTGPEPFTRDFFARLLQRQLDELAGPVTFDAVYAHVAETLDDAVLAGIDSENHLFQLVGREYVPPEFR